MAKLSIDTICQDHDQQYFIQTTLFYEITLLTADFHPISSLKHLIPFVTFHESLFRLKFSKFSKNSAHSTKTAEIAGITEIAEIAGANCCNFCRVTPSPKMP